MSRVFWDTNLFVYLFEDHPEYGPRVAAIRQRMIERGDELTTSAITLGELLAGPISKGDVALARRYRAVLTRPWVTVIPFTEDTAEHYAALRRDRSIARADAIQLACAAQAGTDLFLTNHQRLRRTLVSGIHFIADLDTNIL